MILGGGVGNSFIQQKIEDSIATLTIANPPANALNSQVLRELSSVFDAMAKEAAVKAVVFTGSGPFFISGADIREIAAIQSGTQGATLAAEGQSILNKIERLGKPVIAAVNGVCLGGGLELAMACHLRVASERARFGQPEINLGIIPGFGGTQRLPRLVGKAKAMEMILTGDMIGAQEAKAIGLVNRVVGEAELLKEAQGIARKIASKGQVAVRLALQAIQEGYEKTLTDGLAVEAKLFGQACDTEDRREGLQAFMEKRQPRFQDR